MPLFKNKQAKDLDQREKAAQVIVRDAEAAMKAAAAEAVEARKKHSEAVYAVLAIRHEREGIIQAAEAAKQAEARAARVLEAKNKRLAEFDAAIRAREDESLRHSDAGNRAAVEAIAVDIEKLRTRRAEFAAAA